MRKILMVSALSLVLVLGLALQSSANLTSIDKIGVSPSDKYEITSFTGGASIQENYGNVDFPPGTVFNVIPYASRDGAALVDNAANPIFFDKHIVITPNNANDDSTQFNFQITNNSQLTWSDYDFLLAFDTTVPGDDIQFGDVANINANIFKQFDKVFDGSKLVGLRFWDGAVDPGDTLNVTFEIDYTSGQETVAFDMRQVATVPVPPAALLFGSGLLGLGVLRWRRN